VATILYLRNTTLNGIASSFDVATAVGAATATGIVNTASGGTNIQWTATAGGALIQWVTGKSTTAWTLAGTVNVKLWALESAIQANSGARLRLYRRSTAGVETEITGSPWDQGTEFTTSNAAYTWSFTPTSTAFAIGERLVIKMHITAAGGTMGSARTCTMQYNNSTANSADSNVTLTETVTFSEYVEGTLNVTLGALTLAATGLATVSLGTLNVTLGALTMTATGTAPRSQGTLNVTLGALTLVATGTVANPNVGFAFNGAAFYPGAFNASLPTIGATLNVTLDALTLAATGVVPSKGTLNVTLGALTLVATSKALSSGTLNVTLDALTLAATGKAPAKGTFNVTLDPLTLAATGKVAVKGTLNVTLDPLTLVAFGSGAAVISSGTLNTTLGALTLAATGKVAVKGTFNVTLGALTLAATGIALPPPGKVKVWNGSIWTSKPAKVWTGSAWVTKPAKVWNGTAWVAGA
jgi:hypothetical protein